MAQASTAWQVEIEAAGLYESHFVPAIFRRWAEELVRFAGLQPGQRVLDVACGTGAVARAAAAAVGPEGSVAGCDINAGMLEVARRAAPDIEWVRSDAASLVFDDSSFDVVLCQAALMFFPDPEAAAREMARVTKPGGSVVMQTWGRSSGYELLAGVFDEVTSPEAAAIIRAPFAMHDVERLKGLATAAGLSVDAARTHWDVAEFGSMDDFIRTEILASPMAAMVDPDAVLAAAAPVMKPFEQASGAAVIPLSGNFVRASAG
jgi:SAM-dependent methyltransferase